MDEEAIKNIVEHVVKKIKGNLGTNSTVPVPAMNQIPISVSGRHAHLSGQDLDVLFGRGYELTSMKDLSQPGQFACKETLQVVGPKGMIDRVRILGPIRKETQVELSTTDCYSLGIKDVPVRDSGDLENTPGIVLVGPAGVLKLERGVIIALRHIHMTPALAQLFQVKDKDLVKVKVESSRPVIFENVLIRVSENYALDMHIDTDEANAAGIKAGDFARIVK